MALMLEDLKNNKLYRKQLFLPINASNKKKGSLIYLLSPNIEETARVMASSYFKNPNLFNAYYLEKDINLIINENMVYNEERNPYDPAITLSKYTRYTITDSNEMEKRTGKKLHGSAGILFLKPYTEKYVGYLIVNGSTLVDAYSISAAMDKELMAFAVDILKCNICHKNIDNKYKKILKSEYDFKFAGSSSTGIAQNVMTMEAADILNENFVFSGDNLAVNLDKFESGKTNVLFVTGLSGSGKSTISNTLAKKYNAEPIELDIFETCGYFTDDQLKEAGQVFYNYLSSHKDIWDKLKKKELKGNALNEEIKKFLKYCISWCKSHKDAKWVIEGVQIYSFSDPNTMKNEPIIFVNTSMLKSIIQRWKRNGNGKVDLIAELKNEFPQFVSWYLDNEKALSQFKKSVIEGAGCLDTKTPALLTEGMTRINMELAMWKAQAKITELIIKNWDNTNWMRTQYKSMKAKLNRIPLPGFIDKIDDSIESMKDYYENQKETIKFMTEMAAFELKEEYDISDITKEYTKWVRSTRSSKEFKLKLIREVKESYKETIRTYKMNLKRYEAQSAAEKRVENAVALVGKTFSIFSFLTGGPLGILKDVVMKAILPKSKKKNVLSVSEIEAKIAAYEKIVEELEDLEEEIKNESTNEYTAMVSMNPVIGIGSGPIAKNITSKGRVFSGEDDEDEALQESGVILEGSFEDLVNNIDTSKVGKFLKISAMSILTSPVVGFVLLGHELKKDNDERKAKEKEYEKRVYKNISNALKNAGLEYLTKDDFIKMAKEDYLTPNKHYQQWLDYMGYIVYMNSHAKESDAKNFVFDYITLDGTKYARFNLTSKDNKILYSYIICKKKSNKDTLAFVRILERGKEVEKNAYTVYVDRKPLRNKAAENRKKLADEGDTTWQNDPDNLYSYMISHIDETEKNYLAAYNAAAQVYKSSKILKKHAKLKNASSKIRKLDESKDIVEQIYYKWDNLEIISAEVEPPSKINSDGKDEQIIFWNEFEEARKAAENALLDKDHFTINSEGSRRDICMGLWPKKVSEKKGFFRNLVKEDSLLESPLTTEQRKNLKDSDFGLPAKRAYPMPDKAHVKSAIRMFNHVDKQDEKILASAINRKIKEFDMEDEITVSKKNRYYEYCPSSIREGVEIKPLRTVAVLQEDTFIRDDQSITYFESALSEDATYNKALRRVLYSERLRNQKDVSLHYDAIKDACPFIKQTYYDIDKYRKYNLFVDMTYYIETFIKNNYLKLDKSVNLFFELINRFLRDERFKNAGYNKRTVFVPITGWKVEPNTDIWDYKYNINPISIIYRLIFSGSIERLQQEWGDINFVFIGKNGYFKFTANSMDKKFIPLFRNNVQRLLDGSYIDDSDEPDNSVKGIVADVIARIEKPDDVTDSGIKVNNLLGDDEELTPEEFAERIDASDVSSEDEDDKGLDAEQETIRMEREKELVKRVKEVAKDSASSDDAINKLNNDEDFKQILQDLKMSSPNAVDYSVTRVSRINKLKSDFANTKLDKNKTIGDVVLSDKYFANDLPETSVPIDTTNEEWKHLKGANFADNYNVDNDIYRILYHFSECKVPVAIREVKVEDTSTSEDTVNTWTVACEDINGKRFTLKFDVPIVINKRFMKLRGNEKVMGTQLMNLPIIKTDQYTVQITTNYNKIFISPYGSTVGKSFVTSDRLIKALGKYKGKNITFVTGDNSKICRKYELPIDYIDLASNYMSIKGTNKTTGTYEFLFNQDIVNETYKKFVVKDKLLIGIHTDIKGKQNPIYLDPTITLSSQVAGTLCGLDTEFQEIYNSTSVSSKYMYSLASIMSTHIPVAVLIGYAIGLTPMLDRAGIKYTVEDKRPRYDKSTQDILILKDAYILYDLTYDSSMLLNGLKDCDLDNYSIKEVNSSPMWLDFLDNYGGRIKSDGLDMFYDLMFDPITKSVCLQYDLPNNYIDALLYANMLLSDNKYNKHVDIRGNRYRNNEIIAAYTYKALCNSYSIYRRALKIGRDAPMSIKQSAIIDLILLDNTESDYSYLSPLLEFEAANAVSFKGLSGMNSDRAYGLDKRTYDASMVNILAMSTGFAANAGVNRQSTIDPNISTNRGYIQSNPDKLNITNTFCMTEALTPYGITSDDPFRTAMTFIQTNKHGMRTTIGDPCMISTGADEALVYLTSDTFSHKAKGKGKIKEKTEDYIVIEYDNPIGYDKDNKTEVVDLREKMVKNSDGGFYQSLKLDTNYKVGDIVRKDDIVAIDKLCYSNSVGPTDNYAYDIGTFCKFAVVMSDEGFEDSCRSTQWLAKAMSSTVVVEQEYNFNKDTNIYYLAKKGQSVQEGEPILIFQNAFEDEDANALIRALKAEDEDNAVEELGRITLKSKVTGVVKDIKIRRCVEIDECSPTMQKVIKDYEKSVRDINKAFDKYDKAKAKSADPTYKLPATGKLKNSEDCVLITIYIAYQDDFGVSDKVVCYSALKGTSSKEVIPEGKEAFSTYRPDEKIHYIQSEIGDMKRMVGSAFKIGALNKVLVETHRHMCDIMGIKWKYYDEWDK